MFRTLRNFVRLVIGTSSSNNYYLQLSMTPLSSTDRPQTITGTMHAIVRDLFIRERESYKIWAGRDPVHAKSIIGDQNIYILFTNYNGVFVDSFVNEIRSHLLQWGRKTHFKNRWLADPRLHWVYPIYSYPQSPTYQGWDNINRRNNYGSYTS